MYKEALKNSGYSQPINYDKKYNKTHRGKGRTDTEKNISFNPPHSRNVKTNVGRQSLNLISKHFPQSHKLHKIFNKSNLKVTYSYMKNMNSVIKSHNSKVIRSTKVMTERPKNHAIAETKQIVPSTESA